MKAWLQIENETASVSFSTGGAGHVAHAENLLLTHFICRRVLPAVIGHATARKAHLGRPGLLS
jgi:hypothetical protein